MSRYFVGTGYKKPVSYDVHVEHDSKRYSLMHRVGGSYVDFQWDGGGPGTTDLARALLWEVTGVAPEWRIYSLFKNQVVANWPKCVGECWRISEEEIRLWLAGVERDTARTENASRTEARLEQMHDRDLRLQGFAQMLRKRT
jgi:Family of unknown function (DUF6166)